MSSPQIDLEMIFANLPCHIYWTDREGTILGCNDLQAKSIGFSSRNEAIGRHITDPDISHDTHQTVTIDQQLIRSNQSIKENENGREAIRLSQKIPLRNHSNEVIGLLGISFDLTKMKKQIEPLIYEQIKVAAATQSMLSDSPGYFYWKDRRGHYLGCNAQWVNDLGFQSSQEIVGKTDHDLFSEKIAKRLTETEKQVILSGQSVMVEEEIQLKNEHNIILLSNKKPLFDDKNQVIGIIGSSFDISERKKERNALQTAKIQAEKANQLKTQLIRDVEHDIRTPLSGVWSVLDVWYHDEPDPDKKQMMGEMCRALWQLMEYCDDILDFSRIEHNTMPVKHSPFSLIKLMNSIIEIERITARKKGIILHLNHDDKIPLIVHGDKYRLNRILINLLGNAIKFTQGGEISLTATMEPQLSPHHTHTLPVRFDVKDSGVGMDEPKQQLIRKMFSDINTAEKGLYLGPGLGLRVVSQFTNELNGKMELYSEAGKGSIFSITLPFELTTAKEESHAE